MKIQILIPQYSETDAGIKPLLDSIALQQNVDFAEVGVIIANDGSDTLLSDGLLASYPFTIEHLRCEHRGVSATRNACLDAATAEYVMFCDADDMFYGVCGLYIIFQEIENGGFDTFVSAFIEETRDPDGKPLYVNHGVDGTFVHGKVHRLAYLREQGIRFNDALTIHEDSYFNILAQSLTEDAKFCPNQFYLWKWRDDSVCRHDPKYILRTYTNMLDSSTALVRELQRRGKDDKAAYYATMMILDAYYSLNGEKWLETENAEYRDGVEERFARYWRDFKGLYESIDDAAKSQLIVGLKNRHFAEGMMLESVTFGDWINGIEKRYQ